MGNQAQIVEHLATLGLEATQSSVSRDLRDLAVAKVGGRYVAPPQGRQRALSPRSPVPAGRARPAGPHLTVVRTAEGAAQRVGIALDRAAFPEIVGTLAGDDTVFVATASAADQKRLLQRLEALLLESAR